MNDDVKRQTHNAHQGEEFDRLVDSFIQPIPEDIQARTRRIVDGAKLPAGADLLDVGTGTGVLLPYLLETGPRRLVACDLSAAMLDRAEQQFAGLVQFVRCDVVDLPLAFGPFDAVFCNACFANFFDPQLALRAIHERLRPGGKVIISHPMGLTFVERLRSEAPELELKSMPNAATAQQTLAAAGFLLERLIDEPQLYVLLGRRTDGLAH